MSTPFLRVVRGEPDDVEVAAVTAVVLSLASTRAASTSEPGLPSRWADRAALIRRTLPAGPGAWRASGLPH
jgi:hypothetical protein